MLHILIAISSTIRPKPLLYAHRLTIFTTKKRTGKKLKSWSQKMSRRCLTSPEYKPVLIRHYARSLTLRWSNSVVWVAEQVLSLQNIPRFWHSSLASGNWTLVFSPLEVQYVLNPDQVELDNVNFPGNIHWQQSINFCDWPSMVSFLNQIKCHLEAFYIFCFVQAYLSVLPSTDLYLFICSTSNRQCLQRTEILNNTKQTTRVCIFVHEKKKEILKAETYHWHATEEANRYVVISAVELYAVFALQKQPLEDQIAGHYLNCF